MNALRHILLLCLGVFLSSTSLVYAQSSLVVAGTGDSQQLLSILAKAFSQAAPGLQVEIPDSIGSTGGIRALINDKVPLARTARPFKSEEEGHGLVQHQFAWSPLVFALHPSVDGVSNLASSDLRAIYAGKIKSWSEVGGPNKKIYIVDREPGDSSRKTLKKAMPEFAKVKSVGKVIYSTPDAARAIAKHRFTLGFVPSNWAKSFELNVLSIDGVAPSPEQVKNGNYPLVTPFFIVSKGTPQGIAKRFIAFLSTPAAQSVMRDYGVVPLAP